MPLLKPSLHPAIRARAIEHIDDLRRLRNRFDILTIHGLPYSRYLVGFACSDATINKALRLRYEVFNVELGEGLPSSRATGLDKDIYDDQMTHVVLMDRKTGDVVGTYRVQTIANALAHNGIYSGEEYDLTALESHFHSSVECGRACISIEHRSPMALMGLWHGLAEFLRLTGARWLFGCCSLTSQDPDDGWRALKTLRQLHALHPKLFLPAMPKFSCGERTREHDPDLGPPIPLPKLFGVYVKLGSRVISEPAIDRDFGTVDFLILMDAHRVSLSSFEVHA